MPYWKFEYSPSLHSCLRLTTILTLGCLWLLAAPPATTVAQPLPKMWERVEAAMAEDQVQQTILALERIYHYYRVEKDPRLNWLMARYYCQNGQYDAAMPHLQFFLSMDDTDSLSFVYKPRVLPFYARALHHAGEFRLAEKYYTKVLQTLTETDPQFQKLDLAILQCLNGPIVAQQLDSTVLVEPVSGFINSSYDDYRPAFDPATRSLFFASSRGVLKDKDIVRPDLFTADMQDEYVTAPRRVRKLESPAYKYTLQPDKLPGSLPYVADDQPSLHQLVRFAPRAYEAQQLRLVARQGSKPEDLPAFYQGNQKDKDAHLSTDGRYCFWASLRAEGQGGYDIWMSERSEAGSWSTPQNLGEAINTPYNEASPFFYVPTQTLYYASEGLDAMGGYDIFAVPYLGNQLWGEPKNLGLPINSPGQELYYYRASEDTAFLASSRAGTAGGLDLYFIRMNITDIERTASDLHNRYKEVEAMAVTDTDSLLTTLQATGDSLMAEVDGDDANNLLDTETLDTPDIDKEDAEMRNETEAISEPEEDEDDKLDVDKELEETMNRTLASFPEFFIERAMEKAKTYPEVVRLRHGDRIVLDSLEFEPGTSRFSKHAATDLDKLFWLLVSNPGMQVLITGHTDNQGETEALQQLSQERAMKVVLYLVLNKGIDASRLRYAGKGSTEPLDSNDTPAGRARNNRIEVDIILK